MMKIEILRSVGSATPSTLLVSLPRADNVIQTSLNLTCALLCEYVEDIVTSSATQVAIGVLLIVGLTQLPACAQRQTAPVNGVASSPDKLSQAPLDLQNKSRGKFQTNLEYRGSLPYNGEPPGYYGSSGNPFSGSP